MGARTVPQLVPARPRAREIRRIDETHQTHESQTMKSDPSPFPGDASYTFPGDASYTFPGDASYIGQQLDREADLIRQLKAMRRQAILAGRIAGLLSGALGGLLAALYPIATACVVAFIVLVALVAGGALFLIHRGDPEMGVR